MLSVSKHHEKISRSVAISWIDLVKVFLIIFSTLPSAQLYKADTRLLLAHTIVSF
jgi:hypothetical protein